MASFCSRGVPGVTEDRGITPVVIRAGRYGFYRLSSIINLLCRSGAEPLNFKFMHEKTLCPGCAAGPKAKKDDLENDRNVALESTANAYRDISRYYDRYAEGGGQKPCLVNVRDARYYAGSAMVNMAVAAGGDDDKRIRAILEGYGLEHLM